METRAEINAKYGIVRLMPPSVANEELSPEEVKEYERFTQISAKAFEEYWDEDDSGDVD